jgi:hypothetical protein
MAFVLPQPIRRLKGGASPPGGDPLKGCGVLATEHCLNVTPQFKHFDVNEFPYSPLILNSL